DENLTLTIVVEEQVPFGVIVDTVAVGADEVVRAVAEDPDANAEVPGDVVAGDEVVRCAEDKHTCEPVRCDDIARPRRAAANRVMARAKGDSYPGKVGQRRRAGRTRANGIALYHVQRGVRS